uniref:Exocyst complex component Sec3 PIP2-binding N-terminal domain-containing protein n=1 Tax=Parascaris univalens TaxID=6257 RepID=A0A914ZGK6_PARUN
MRAIVSDLQHAVFQVDDERLVAVANILRVDNKKKKKPTFLCLVVTVDQPISVRLYFVKNEKDDIFKKKEHFSLRDVKTVDGINPRKMLPQFDLAIGDHVYKLCASTPDEKDAFIKQLYKFASKYLPVQKPDFVNVPIPVDTPHAVVAVEQVEDGPEENFADYQPISAKEEADFRRLLARAQLTIGEADKFATILGEQLQQLDGANIQSIMDSEAAVNGLISLIDAALLEADRLDAQLDTFDKLLYHVRDSVELIEEKDSLGCVERKNTRVLREYLAETLNAIDVVSDEHIRILQHANLSDPMSISRCCAAARAVQLFNSSKVNPSMHLMLAYKQRSELLNQVTDEFIEKLMAHLSALFYNLNELTEAPDWHEVALRKQSERFHALRPFSDLIAWLKVTRPLAYESSVQRYVQNTKVIYKKEFERFFEVIGNELNRLANAERRATLKNLDSSKSSLERTFRCESKIDQKALINLVEIVLGEVGPVVESEQKFCTRFFHMSGDLLATIETQSTSSGESGIGRSVEKQIADQVRNVLTPILEPLHEHLDKFIKACCRAQSSIVFVLFVLLSKKALTLQDSSSYFSVMVFGRLVVLVKRQLDIFMDNEAHYLADVRISKKTRIGILDNLERFKEVACAAEAAFAETERRADLDRWYAQLICCMREGIERAAVSPYSKSPPAVVRFENYHQLYSILSELKIACLDAQRKEAKKSYQENIQSYVKEYMGKPLEKVHVFFEGIEQAIEQGMKPEEIAFQQQFSRAELRKVLALYPGKEVKKGLEQLYRNVEKHLVENSPLLQVVWRHMQDEFLKELKRYHQIIGQCYANSRIDLEVSIQDVLTYFSQFAQEH